jgi:hypothetical protein
MNNGPRTTVIRETSHRGLLDFAGSMTTDGAAASCVHAQRNKAGRVHFLCICLLPPKIKPIESWGYRAQHVFEKLAGCGTELIVSQGCECKQRLRFDPG